jgi:rod shape-determining protein MreC
MLRALTGTTRLILLLFALLLSVIFILPKQSGDLLQGLGRPVSYLLSLPISAIAAVDRGITNLWQGYLDLRGVHEENKQLRREILFLRSENNELREKAAAVDRLSHMLSLKERMGSRTVAARVIGRDPSNLYRGVILDKGERDGIHPEMGVMVASGVVGRVIRSNHLSSVVLLVSDPHNGIAGIVQRSRDEGIVEGTPQGTARIKYLPLLSSVRIGDIVVTSGLTGGFPRGLVIGSITSFEKAEGALFQSAEIALEADLSKLEEVLVITEPRSEDGTESKENKP